MLTRRWLMNYRVDREKNLLSKPSLVAYECRAFLRVGRQKPFHSSLQRSHRLPARRMAAPERHVCVVLSTEVFANDRQTGNDRSLGMLFVRSKPESLAQTFRIFVAGATKSGGCRCIRNLFK